LVKKNVVKPAGFSYFRSQLHHMVPGQTGFALRRVERETRKHNKQTKQHRRNQMKFNKWTMGLAAVGVVSLASAARADEKLSPVQTALSNTTLSGYVDTSAMWQIGQQNGGNIPKYTPGGVASDGFNLNSIDLALDKPLDESPWAAGYHAELMFGPDAVPGSVTTTQISSGRGRSTTVTSANSSTAIRQAYLTLRTPVGNSGIDWKVGVFDSILGYESTSDGLNPNYTRSYGYMLEPTTLTGVLGTYKVNDSIAFSAGVADTANGLDNRAQWETQKAYLGSIALTAPDSWGWAKGATLNAGVINGDSGSAVNGGGSGTTSWYAGVVVPTPLTALKMGASFDYLELHNGSSNIGNSSDDSSYDVALYGNYQYNDKLSFNLRGEYLNDGAAAVYPFVGTHRYYGPHEPNSAEEVTATVSYQLWANVLSRVEFRWDHVSHGDSFDATSSTNSRADRDNAFLLALNLIYQF
jgi:hypothetical protein